MKKIKLFENKKAQITIFIIIGIVLLFSSALVIYIKNKMSNTTLAPTVIQNVPEDLVGMQKYIEDCIYKTGKDAVVQIGMHGGYINITNPKYGIRTNPTDPTEASGIERYDGSGKIVPYWYYLESPNTCKGTCAFKSKMPYLRESDGPDSIESQISEYVTANFRSCLNNFDTYINLGYDIKQGVPSTRTTITQQDVVLDVTWPIEAGRTTDKLKKIEKFVVRLPVNLRQAYNFAKEISEKQVKYNYFETHTLNLITYYSDKTKNQLPPMADFTFKKEIESTWVLNNVKDSLSFVLSNYVKVLRIRNSVNGINFPYPDPTTQMIMDKTLINLDDGDISHPYEVSFLYSTLWPIYLDITPRNGLIIQPKSILGSFGALSLMPIDMKQYEFQYDISYPIMVSLYDKTAFNNEQTISQNEGFNFLFAIETNIRNNHQINSSFSPLSPSNAGRSYVCDEQQKNSGNVSVSTFDAITKKPLTDVSVTLSFGGPGCQIGLTKLNASINKSILIERYPSGAIGSLTFSKEGYLSETMPMFTAKEGVNKEVEDIYLYPLIEKKISLKTYRASKDIQITKWDYESNFCSHSCSSWTLNYINNFNYDNITNTTTTYKNYSVRPHETVTVILNKVLTSESPSRVSSAFFFNGSIINDSEKRTISLGPGRYELTITSSLYENMILPSRTFSSKKESFTLDAQKFNPYMEGTMNFNNETYYFDISPEDLYTNTSLEFYALVYDLKSVISNSINLTKRNLTCSNLAEVVNCASNPDDLSPTPDMKTMMKNTKNYLYPKFVNNK